jgi:mono/diheme cytochrome c family protein
MSMRKQLPMLALMSVLCMVAAGGGSAGEALDGKALYKERCGMCHQTIGMAVGILSRRPADASMGLLEDRADLSALFVRTVVRSGIANMPRMPRAEISDAELAAVATYLSRGKP